MNRALHGRLDRVAASRPLGSRLDQLPPEFQALAREFIAEGDSPSVIISILMDLAEMTPEQLAQDEEDDPGGFQSRTRGTN